MYMNKLIKSLYLSIIFSGIIYIVYYLLVEKNNYLIFLGIFIILFSVIYLFKLKSAPKYTKKEVIEKFNLPVSPEESLVVTPKEVLVETIESPSIVFKKEYLSKKSLKKAKDIPKQNVSYKNYAEVFKNINQNLINEKKLENEKDSEEKSSEE